MTSPQEQIAAQLLHTKSLPVSQQWLNSFISSSAALQRNVPLSALTQTALFRVLASDFRQSLSTANPSSLLPVDIFDPNVKERRLQGSIPVQVLDIEDIGTSLWSQIEAIERVERGEAIRGREIVRTVNVSDDNEERENTNSATRANATGNAAGRNAEATDNGPHRLILQDAAGTRAVAIELRTINGVAVGKLPIGSKLLLRNVTVARGMVLLTPEDVTLLGGKIESIDQVWRDGRKARLMARLVEMEGEQGQRQNGNQDAMEE